MPLKEVDRTMEPQKHHSAVAVRGAPPAPVARVFCRWRMAVAVLALVGTQACRPAPDGLRGPFLTIEGNPPAAQPDQIGPQTTALSFSWTSSRAHSGDRLELSVRKQSCHDPLTTPTLGTSVSYLRDDFTLDGRVEVAVAAGALDEGTFCASATLQRSEFARLEFYVEAQRDH